MGGQALHVARDAEREARASRARVVGHEIEQGGGDGFRAARVGVARGAGVAHWTSSCEKNALAGGTAGWRSHRNPGKGGIRTPGVAYAVRISFPFWVRRRWYSRPLW